MFIEIQVWGYGNVVSCEFDLLLLPVASPNPILVKLVYQAILAYLVYEAILAYLVYKAILANLVYQAILTNLVYQTILAYLYILEVPASPAVLVSPFQTPNTRKGLPNFF